MEATMPADLARDTAVRADPNTPGRYHVELPENWNYVLPSGGVVMTCALRAAETHLAEPPLRFASATTIFPTPIHAGELIADVHVLRRGRGATQVRVALTHAKAQANDDTGLEMIATFLRERRGPDVVAREAPAWALSLADAAPVEDGAPNNPHTRFPFFHQVECKLAVGDAFWRPDFAAGPAQYARWFRYRAPQR